MKYQDNCTVSFLLFSPCSFQTLDRLALIGCEILLGGRSNVNGVRMRFLNHIKPSSEQSWQMASRLRELHIHTIEDASFAIFSRSMQSHIDCGCHYFRCDHDMYATGPTQYICLNCREALFVVFYSRSVLKYLLGIAG